MILCVYKFLRTLSLDVAFGAVVFSSFIANMIDVFVPSVVYIELAIAVWCIYTLDHLKDAASVDKPSTYRHLFHKLYAKELYIALLVSLLIGSILIYFLPVKTLYLGVMLFIFVLLYFIVIHFQSRFYQKEILIAILYAAGVFLGPYSCSIDSLPAFSLLICFFFTVFVAFINLLIFSDFEKKSDLKDGYFSMAILLGKYTKLVIYVLLLIQFITMLISYVFEFLSLEVLLCYSLMNIVLGIIYFGKRFSIKNEYYRILGDGIFFIPIFFL